MNNFQNLIPLTTSGETLMTNILSTNEAVNSPKIIVGLES